ncbi:MAG: hypothetical protein KA767_02035 [Saprospiraceae bacterium]|nr:hypothetical protein [Saprospiraceae bacterium]MBP7642085.1 hypothetical protein [Saprospiraceae bacterium]
MKTIKSLILILNACLLQSCTNEISVLGTWRCDRTGTVKVETGTDKERSLSVVEFYDELGMPPMAYEFLENDTMIWHNSLSKNTSIGKVTTKFRDKKYPYQLKYQGNPNKVLIRTNNGKDENIMTIKSISSNKMKISFESGGDKMLFDLVMTKIK